LFSDWLPWSDLFSRKLVRVPSDALPFFPLGALRHEAILSPARFNLIFLFSHGKPLSLRCSVWVFPPDLALIIQALPPHFLGPDRPAGTSSGRFLGTLQSTGTSLQLWELIFTPREKSAPKPSPLFLSPHSSFASPRPRKCVDRRVSSGASLFFSMLRTFLTLSTEPYFFLPYRSCQGLSPATSFSFCFQIFFGPGVVDHGTCRSCFSSPL